MDGWFLGTAVTLFTILPNLGWVTRRGGGENDNKIYNLIFYSGSYSGKLPLVFFVILQLTRNKPYILSH